jgi:hypothetical protein
MDGDGAPDIQSQNLRGTLAAATPESMRNNSRAKKCVQMTLTILKR